MSKPIISYNLLPSEIWYFILEPFEVLELVKYKSISKRFNLLIIKILDKKIKFSFLEFRMFINTSPVKVPDSEIIPDSIKSFGLKKTFSIDITNVHWSIIQRTVKKSQMEISNSLVKNLWYYYKSEGYKLYGQILAMYDDRNFQRYYYHFLEDIEIIPRPRKPRNQENRL